MIKYRIAQVLVIIGNWMTNKASSLSIDAYEENWDGTRPFGRIKS